MTKPVDVLREKRQMQRFSIALPSKITADSEKPPVLDLVSRNLCAGGGFYLTDNPLPIGTRVTIEMAMRLGEPGQSDATGCQISVSGTVMRTADDGMAVRFAKRYKIASMIE